MKRPVQPDGSEPARWYPSRRQLAFDWYMTRLVRLLGMAGFIWELAIDKGRNPLILLLSVQLAATLDILQVIRGLIAQARQDRTTLERLVKEQGESEEQ
jgi:hypothetical protein